MRGFMVAALTIMVAIWTGTDALAQEEGAEWLFVQTAESVTLADGVVTLHGVSPATLFFSDRPEKSTAYGLTLQFVTYWQNLGDDSFGDDPPNATLAIVENDEAERCRSHSDGPEAGWHHAHVRRHGSGRGGLPGGRPVFSVRRPDRDASDSSVGGRRAQTYGTTRRPVLTAGTG